MLGNFFSKKILFSAMAIVAILAILFALFLIPDKIAESKYLNITNLDYALKKSPRNINSKQKTEIKQVVSWTLKDNDESIQLKNIKDAKVREESFNFKASTKEPDGDYEIFFLVDIPSIKQTYRLTHVYKKKGNTTKTYADCPLKQDLIYPDFTCGDRFYKRGQERDEIFKITPTYQDNHGFRIKARQNRDKDGKLVIMIKVLSAIPEKQAAIKSLAREYLEKKGIKLENYTIIYE